MRLEGWSFRICGLSGPLDILNHESSLYFLGSIVVKFIGSVPTPLLDRLLQNCIHHALHLVLDDYFVDCVKSPTFFEMVTIDMPAHVFFSDCPIAE